MIILFPNLQSYYSLDSFSNKLICSVYHTNFYYRIGKAIASLIEEPFYRELTVLPYSLMRSDVNNTNIAFFAFVSFLFVCLF